MKPNVSYEIEKHTETSVILPSNKDKQKRLNFQHITIHVKITYPHFVIHLKTDNKDKSIEYYLSKCKRCDANDIIDLIEEIISKEEDNIFYYYIPAKKKKITNPLDLFYETSEKKEKSIFYVDMNFLVNKIIETINEKYDSFLLSEEDTNKVNLVIENETITYTNIFKSFYDNEDEIEKSYMISTRYDSGYNDDGDIWVIFKGFSYSITYIGNPNKHGIRRKDGKNTILFIHDIPDDMSMMFSSESEQTRKTFKFDITLDDLKSPEKLTKRFRESIQTFLKDDKYKYFIITTSKMFDVSFWEDYIDWKTMEELIEIFGNDIPMTLIKHNGQVFGIPIQQFMEIIKPVMKEVTPIGYANFFLNANVNTKRESEKFIEGIYKE